VTRRDTAFAVAATTLVIAGLVLGFWQLGGRARQRDLRADAARENDLRDIALRIHNGWSAYARDEDRKLPVTLAENRQVEMMRVRTKDPITGSSYEYTPKTGSQYELCAVFAIDNSEPQRYAGAAGSWAHPKGRYCFPLNAAVVPPPMAAPFPY
jgi:hypothetical protein